MKNFVLYCKSYKNDVYRVKTLLDSIVQYNEDKIPFYISCPKEDIQLFKQILGNENYILLSDEEITADNNKGWLGQQVVKSQFHTLNLCDNYLCLDSDSFFIKPFHVSDFMFNDNTPYTVCHQQRDLFVELEKFGIVNQLGFNPYRSFISDRKKIKDYFENDYNTVYDFGPSPVIWSTKVWKSISNQYSINELLNYCPSEFTWYGEFLIKNTTISIYPKNPLFKVYHYRQQYDLDMKICNNNVDTLKKLYSKYNYLGIVIQSNFKDY